MKHLPHYLNNPMTKLTTITFFLFFTVHGLNAQKDGQIVIGSKHVIHSDVLDEDREYWISMPESYHQEGSSHKHYPLLIVLDGRLHFRSVSGMVNYMSAGYNRNRRIPEMIVVAIQNVSRTRDFTPDKIVTSRKNDFGGGDNFLSFLETELIPDLDSRFRTMPYRILFGHSLGGLLATHAYMKAETLFNAFIAVDPSFGGWDAETMDKKLDTVTDQSFERFIYFATANWGKRNIRNRDRHLRLYEALNSKCEGGFPAKLEYFEDENHGSVPPIAFHNGISEIFKGYDVSARDIGSKADLAQHFQSLSERLSFSFNPPETLVNSIGYRMLTSRNKNERLKALEFFTLNTENYPASSNAFDSLGEAYEALGDKPKAISSYQKSLELNPNNEHAEIRIESLKK